MKFSIAVEISKISWQCAFSIQELRGRKELIAKNKAFSKSRDIVPS